MTSKLRDERIYSATLTSEGQVTLPKQLRDELGLEVGKKVEFVFHAGQVTLRTLRPHRRSFVEAIGTLAPFEGLGAESYISELRHAAGDHDILQSGPGVKKVTRISDVVK